MARIRKLIMRAILLLSFLFGLASFTREVKDRKDRVIRESPVDFEKLSSKIHNKVPPPERAVRWFNGTHFDDRYRIVRHLKDGYQGSVYLCLDTHASARERVVVKTISAISRNVLPAGIREQFINFTNTWPSEIDASLSIRSQERDEMSAFVPVYDYFITQNVQGPSERPQWAWTLVTPYIKGGTLIDLARRLHETERSAAELDRQYRRSFSRLVADLKTLHREGYCHDDVKPLNVFIRSPEHFLLGDLGSVRNYDHGWHSTELWRRRNQWTDCRLNDIRRAWKSYMDFLRNASADRDSFDVQFLDVAGDWSKLYWEFMQAPAEAYERGIPEQVVIPEQPEAGHTAWTWKLGKWHRQLLTDNELACTSLWYKLRLTY